MFFMAALALLRVSILIALAVVGTKYLVFVGSLM